VKLYLRLLRYLRPHLRMLVLSIVCMAGYAAFSGATIGLVVPFSRILLYGGTPEVAATLPGSGAPQPAPVDSARAATSAKPSLAGWARERAKGMIAALVHSPDRLETLRRFCFVIVLVFLLKNIFWYAQSFLIVRVEQGVIRDLRASLYRHYLGLPIEFYNDAGAGTLISRITNDVTLVRGAIANGFAQGLRQSLLILAYTTAVILANWRLFLLTLLVAPPAFYLINRVGRRLRRYSTRSQERMADITGGLQETILGIRIIKAFNLERHMGERFRRVNEDYGSSVIRMNRTGALAPPITEMLGAGMGVIILYLGGRDIVRGAGMEGAQFLMFLIGLFALMQPIRALSQVNIQIEEGIAASERIFKILDTPPTVRDAPRARSLAPPVREIRFEDVSFEHVPGVPVLRDIRFDVQAGEMIAIVGLSGAGKSTLIDLLPRFYDPDAGRILINGEDIRVVRLESLRSMIGLVTQETVLFDDTVEANIALGKPGATHEEIVRASEAANAHRFIREMPQGYATPIGDRGMKLSGGQRQRLAIARAILRDPPILVLDEATSALDSESEALVQEAVERLLRNRTTFVIAHRLSTVQEADRILVLDRGRIEDEGTHDELLARDGLYQRLYRMQFRDATAERSSAAAAPAEAADAARETAGRSHG